MTTQGSRAEPGNQPKKEGPRSLTATRPSRQEEENTHLAFFYGNAAVDGVQSGDGNGLPQYWQDGVVATYEMGPDGYFQRVTLSLVGAPDHG